MCHLRKDGMLNKCKADINEAQGNIKLVIERKIYGLRTLSCYKNKNFTYSWAGIGKEKTEFWTSYG